MNCMHEISPEMNSLCIMIVVNTCTFSCCRKEKWETLSGWDTTEEYDDTGEYLVAIVVWEGEGHNSIMVPFFPSICSLIIILNFNALQQTENEKNINFLSQIVSIFD